jgi:hypothetical protein
VPGATGRLRTITPVGRTGAAVVAARVADVADDVDMLARDQVLRRAALAGNRAAGKALRRGRPEIKPG